MGSDLVPAVLPAVLRKLSPSIRSLIREQPSSVGFRFGNNQVLCSFKQLQIPLVHGKKRIWLLIEVVPKDMKSLGANIDLSNNTCFLKNLQRSLPLRENDNGLPFDVMFVGVSEQQLGPLSPAFRCCQSNGSRAQHRNRGDRKIGSHSSAWCGLGNPPILERTPYHFCWNYRSTLGFHLIQLTSP